MKRILVGVWFGGNKLLPCMYICQNKQTSLFVHAEGEFSSSCEKNGYGKKSVFSSTCRDP